MQLERAILTTWLRHLPYESVKLEELERLADQITPSLADFRAGLLQLQNKGIVRTIKGQWDESWIQLPHLHKIYRDCFSLKNEQAFVHDEITVIGSEISLMEIFLRMLIYINQQPLQRTNRGNWNKKQLTELNRFAELERLLTHFTINDLLAWGLEMQFLKEVDHRLLIESEKVKHWLHMPRSKAEAIVYDQWKKAVLKQSSTRELHFVHWLECQQFDFTWLSLSAFYRWLHKYDLGDERNVESFVQRWLQQLVQYGWLHLAETNRGDVFMKWTLNSEPASADIYVQPDFELIVPSEVNLRIIWWIESIADRLQVEANAIRRYTLSKNSVIRALKCGLTSDQMIDFLSAVSKFPLPSHIVSAIYQWSGQIRSTIPNDSPYIPNWRPAGLSDQWMNTNNGCERSQQDVTCHRTHSSYRSNSRQRLLDYKELYPYLERVPPIWLDQLRSYHHSTYVKIIRAALYYQARLYCRVTDHSHKVIPLIPKKLYINEEKGWTMVAIDARKQKVEIGKQQILAMQLILPGVNDSPILWKQKNR